MPSTICSPAPLDSSTKCSQVLAKCLLKFIVRPSNVLIFLGIFCIEDVRKLLPDDLLGDPLAAGMARAFNTKTCKVIDAPSGSKVVVGAT